MCNLLKAISHITKRLNHFLNHKIQTQASLEPKWLFVSSDTVIVEPNNPYLGNLSELWINKRHLKALIILLWSYEFINMFMIPFS